MIRLVLKNAWTGFAFTARNQKATNVSSTQFLKPNNAGSYRFITLTTAPFCSKFRDMSLPYTEKELAGLRSLFRSMPSHKNGFILTTEDFPKLLKEMKWKRTPEQVQNYVDYFHLFYGGKLSEEDLIQLMKSEHKLNLFAKETAKKMDQDGNGFISADEFKLLIRFLRIHDPKLKERAYEDFLKEGSTRKDGKVSIDECANWIQKCV